MTYYSFNESRLSPLVVERERTQSEERELLRERSRERGIERDGPDIGWSR